MSKIVRLQKTLIRRSEPEAVPGVTIRPFRDPEDLDAWLRLREAAFAGLVAAGRPWTPEDFRREFARSRLWAAVRQPADQTGPAVVGAVALGRVGRPPNDYPSLQWLMVAPGSRRCGVGRALIAVVEQTVWDADERELRLETHVDWSDAFRLYGRCGYAAIR